MQTILYSNYAYTIRICINVPISYILYKTKLRIKVVRIIGLVGTMLCTNEWHISAYVFFESLLNYLNVNEIGSGLANQEGSKDTQGVSWSDALGSYHHF